MKVTLDATVILSRKFGIGFYAENLVRSLAPRKSEVTALYRFVRNRELPRDLPRLERRMPYRMSDLLFDRLGIPGDGFCGAPEVFHALSSFLPRFDDAKAVWTLYDLAFKVNPEWFTKETAAGLEKTTRRALDRADHVITISENTRKDLIRFYGFPADRITSVPLAASRHSLGTFDRPKGFEAPYILNVGTIEPRKNIGRLLDAFMKARTDYRLVVVGARGWRCDELIPRLGGGRITWIDYAGSDLLAALYQHADAFVYPSLYEGFGLPVLEAMSHGRPVITSRSSSIPEVAGDAALYIDPDKTAELVGAIERISDPTLRADLSRKSLAQAKRFSWDRTAAETWHVYKRCQVQ